MTLHQVTTTADSISNNGEQILSHLQSMSGNGMDKFTQSPNRMIGTPSRIDAYRDIMLMN